MSYNALISACEKGQQWQLGLSLFTLIYQAPMADDVGGCGFGFSFDFFPFFFLHTNQGTFGKWKTLKVKNMLLILCFCSTSRAYMSWQYLLVLAWKHLPIESWSHLSKRVFFHRSPRLSSYDPCSMSQANRVSFGHQEQLQANVITYSAAISACEQAPERCVSNHGQKTTFESFGVTF